MLYGVVVVYNKNCKDSSSIQDIKNYSPDMPIVVFDNSDVDQGNREYCEANDIIYFSKRRNIGISKAYNYVISHLSLKANDYLMMLDDDTHLDKNYFNEAENLVTTDFDVFLPIIKADSKIISPYNFYMGSRSKMITHIEEIDLNKVSGINSGMIIRAKLFKKIKYNEKLFLDYVDYDFMRQVHKVGGKIKVMNSIINQEFQYFDYSKTSLESAIFRFKIDSHDYKILCKESNMSWFYYVHVLKFALKQTKRYKNTQFLKSMFKSNFSMNKVPNKHESAK